MDDDKQGDKAIFTVTVEDLQSEALKRMGRKLNFDELHTAKKCIECGLSSCIDITLRAAIDEAVRLNHKKGLSKRKSTESQSY